MCGDRTKWVMEEDGIRQGQVVVKGDRGALDFVGVLPY